MKNGVLIIILSLLATFAHANITATVESPQSCTLCGMNRTNFAYSRMLAVFADGTATGFCSLHCLAVEMQQKDCKRISSIKVADYSTYKLTDAKTAVWVIGGSMNGVMTSEAKWAFVGMEEAQKFVATYGGRISTFVQALEAATNEVKAQAAEELAIERELSRELR